LCTPVHLGTLETVERPGDRRARIATFGVAITAAVIATAMNRVQVAQANTTPGTGDVPVATTVVESTATDVVAFG
jgi:hypothetical protein